MKGLAISILAWQPEQETAVLPLLQEHGITGLETAPARVRAGAASAGDYRQTWNDHGIRLCAMQSLLYGAPPCALFEGDILRQQMFDNLEQACALAQALGITNLVFGSNRQRLRGALPYETAFAQATAFFRKAAAMARRYDTCLCLEPVPEAHGCDFITHSHEAAALVDAVNDAGFGLHLDSACMVLGHEDPLEVLQRYRDRVRHFHASEPHLKPIGTQGVDHARIAAALRACEYRHWVSVEMFATAEPARELAQALATARHFYGS